MQLIGTADLKKYWINFEQLRQRWRAHDELIASYCVCVDARTGNPPLIPHFDQGEFPTPDGNICKRLAKYEQKYKNYVSYLEKSETDSQLIEDFLRSISGIAKNKLWFLLSDVNDIEAEDYSLQLAAQSSMTTSSEAYATTSYRLSRSYDPKRESLRSQQMDVKDMGWITFEEQTLYLHELYRRWAISSYTLVDIIMKSIDIDGICKLQPFIKKETTSGPVYKPLKIDIDNLRISFLVDGERNRRPRPIAFRLSHVERAEREKLISATKSDVKVQHNDTSYSKILEEKVELEIKLAGAMSTIAKLKGFDFNDAPKQKDLYISELESQLAKSQKRLKDTEEDLEVTQTKLSDTTVLLEDAEEQIKAKDARIAELEVGPTDVPSPATENSVPAEGGTTRWQSSVEAVCKAIIEVCRSGRTDWVSGQHAAETTDSTGQETFNALLTRMYDGERAVMAQAERAAWRVLAGSGFKRGAGRPSNK